MYGMKFQNLEKGAFCRGGTDGFISAFGCDFKDITNVALDLSTQGNHIVGCNFTNVNKVLKSKYESSVQNINVNNEVRKPIAMTGHIAEVISSRINGFEKALEAKENQLVSDVESDGVIELSPSTWVGLSKFSNLDRTQGASLGNVDLTPYVDMEAIPIPSHAPKAPTGLKVVKDGADMVLTWKGIPENENALWYLIERRGEEIGRTNWNHHANFYYVIEQNWGPAGWPGPGVYRNPPTIFRDKGAAGQFSAGDYQVHSVGINLKRSDGKMAKIRQWPNSALPVRVTADGKRTVDSVTVQNGPIGMRKTGKVYTAIAYSPYSQSGVKRGLFPLRSANIRRFPEAGKMGPALDPDKKIAVVDLNGRIVLVLTVGKLSIPGVLENTLRAHGHRSGTYLIPELNKKVSLVF